jgi:hypothetical protein
VGGRVPASEKTRQRIEALLADGAWVFIDTTRALIPANAGCARNPGSPSASIKTKVIAKLLANLIASQKFR